MQEAVGLSLLEMQQADPMLQEIRGWVEQQAKPIQEESARKFNMHLTNQECLSACDRQRTGCWCTRTQQMTAIECASPRANSMKCSSGSIATPVRATSV